MRNSLLDKLTQAMEVAIIKAGLDKSYAKLTVSDRPDLGDYQCNAALAAAKQYKKNPREIAQSIVDVLRKQEEFASVDLAGPGFINLRVSDQFLKDHLQDMIQDQFLGAVPVGEKKHILIDYGGPNVAKPMHVGHLRSAIIGESLKRISRFLQHKVTADVHLGDWGLQMGLIISELQRRKPDLPYFHDNSNFPIESPVSIDELEEIYPTASKRSKEDEEANNSAHEATTLLQQGNPGYRALWQHFVSVSVEALKKDYARLEIEFDLWLGESDAHELSQTMISQLKQRGLAIEDQGALIIPLAEEDDEQPIAPLILVNKNGAVLYGTTDLATIKSRIEDLEVDKIWYVVDLRQRDHFIQVFRSARKTDIAGDEVELEHIGFGTINGKDGKPFKTREGGVMKLNDLIDMVTQQADKRIQETDIAKDYSADEKAQIAQLVGIAALKFSDLINYRSKNYIFDLEKFVSFEGKTGPYLLYSTVRGKSILNKAQLENIICGNIIPAKSEVERDLLLKIVQFPEILQLSFETRAPNHLCEYAYNLCIAFNRFYRDHHILKEQDKQTQISWLTLTDFTVKLLNKILYLLGIKIPERM